MKIYEFKLVIEEGNDEFWEHIKGSGCNEVENLLKNILLEYGFYEDNCEIKLVAFQEK